MVRIRKKKVLVAMSGGVDSSVAAALLKKRGWEVVGGFIKNWSDSRDLWTGECQWRAERRDAIRVAARLGIPLLTFDFETAYRRQVVDELFAGYAQGVTPNPDVLCNEAIKFGLFFQAAKKRGFDYMATGHYARVHHLEQGEARLLRGVDDEKDQSYFLYRVPQEALRRTVFPIGHLRKAQVRKLAREFKLPVANKPDSQGICFIGKLSMKDFLRKHIPIQAGDIVDPAGRCLGQHNGLDSYTVGQRQGIKLAQGGHAWYVVRKDVDNNRLVVAPSPEHVSLYESAAGLSDLRWTRGKAPKMPARVQVQVRYHQAPTSAILKLGQDAGTLRLDFAQPVKAVAPGQSAVFYAGSECLGGGIIL